KDMLRKRKLSMKGRKCELIERLQLSDLSTSELKMKLRREGLNEVGSKTELIRKVQKLHSKGKEIQGIDTVKDAHRKRGNPWMVLPPMNCNGCGCQVTNNDAMSHLDSCWFTNDGEPNVYLLHAKSADWAEKFELYMAVPLNGSFKDVDLSLRFTWLQCCYGHLSGMEIYSSNAFNNLKETDKDPDPIVTLNSRYYNVEGLSVCENERPMETLLLEYIQDGIQILYEYDAGFTTSILIHNFGKRCLKRPLREETTTTKILMPVMRNEMLTIPCEKCYKKSTLFFMDDEPYDSEDDVSDSDFGMKFFCSDRCALSLGFRRHTLKPFLNSPRSGSCDYRGLNYF
ncbi:uncharacterized protein LOC144353316, partial [Saccoglossus kowalevskii]